MLGSVQTFDLMRLDKRGENMKTICILEDDVNFIDKEKTWIKEYQDLVSLFV